MTAQTETAGDGAAALEAARAEGRRKWGEMSDAARPAPERKRAAP